MTSGVSVSETSVATRSPTARPSGDSGPTSSTVPTSIPPEPVTGFCILPRAATMSSTSAADRVPVAAVLALELAERRGVEVEPLDPDPDLVGPELASGVEPLRRLRQHAGARRAPGADRSDRRPTYARWPTSPLVLPWIRSETGNCPAWHWTCRRLSAYSGMSSAPATTDAPDRRPCERGPTHEHRDGHRPARRGQPYAYRASSWSSPTGRASRAGATSRPSEWESVQWQRAHCVKNVKQLRELIGDLLDERFYADLERDQAERATMSMLVPPQMMNTMVPTSTPAGPGSLTEAFYADPVRHYMLPVFSRPAHRLAVAPARHPRLAARARHVGRRGADPPLPDQGARRAAADLPAVLRPLHPDGPGRQLDAGHRQAEVRRQAGRPARRHDRLPAPYAGGARRRRLRRRRGQHAVAAARGLPHQAARDREHPRHPAGHQGADGAAAALAAGRRRRRHGPGRVASPARAASRSRSTRT